MEQHYSTLSKLSKSKFRRYTGVAREAFEMMVLVVQEGEKSRKLKEGRPPKVCLEDQILMTLTYYREYRTLFHLGTDYGIHESNVQRTIEKIEAMLLQSGYFNLPGKKVLLSSTEIDAILIDATETPAQRPKKKSKKAGK